MTEKTPTPTFTLDPYQRGRLFWGDRIVAVGVVKREWTTSPGDPHWLIEKRRDELADLVKAWGRRHLPEVVVTKLGQHGLHVYRWTLATPYDVGGAFADRNVGQVRPGQPGMLDVIV